MTAAPESTQMFAEASEGARVVADQLTANADVIAEATAWLRAYPPRAALTIARGSSDHAATFAKYLLETRAGLMTASGAPSTTSLYGAAAEMEGVLALAISQSGRSPDLVASFASARSAGAHTFALVNDADAPLAALAHAVLPLRAGAETSVAATKSFIATLSALVNLVSAWREHAELARALADAPAALARAWEADWSALVDALVDADGLYVIGRGLGLGIAQEAALKFKETCGLHAEAFSAAELRHGPMALVEPGFAVLLFVQDDETADGVRDLARDLVSRGARVFVAGAACPGAVALASVDAHPAIAPMLHIQSFYRAVNALSVARGRDPDRPPHLAKVTETV